MYPNPMMHRQVTTLTSPANYPGGFLYDAPYPSVEHDYAAEVNFQEAEKKEARKKERAAKRAADPSAYPSLRATKPTSPPRSTGYGRAMGNDGVGTLRYLGINWDDVDEEK